MNGSWYSPSLYRSAAPGISNKYGFDDWKDLQYDFNVERTSYISLEASKSTQFYVDLKLKEGVFDQYQIIIDIDYTNELSFTPVSQTTARDINSGLTLITLYSLSSTAKGYAHLKVKARSGEESFCLAGDCATRDDFLKVIVFEELIYDNYQVYPVCNPSFNPDPNVFKEQFNEIIKQAVLKIESVEKRSYNNWDWDDNGDGILDLFVSTNDVPNERLEHERLLTSIESTYTNVPTCYTGCPPDEQEPKTMILPGTIRRNWLIMEAVSVSDLDIKLNSIIDLKKGDEIYIRTWGGTPEWNEIDDVDPNNNIITLTYFLSNSYPEHSVVTDCQALVKGFTMESCTWVEDLDNYRNLIHEFCHMKSIGPLSHTIEDTTNLMYLFYGNYGSNIRYRDLETDNKFGLGDEESQWQQLHTIYTE